MKLAVIAIAALVTGCASSGVQVSQQAATQFKEGVSTEADIVRTLGRPTSVTVSSNRKFISYSGAQYQVKPASFIPIVGAFAGGADYTVSTATYEIGPDGVLQHVTFTQAGSGSRAGTTPVEMPATEPRAVR
jgi:outer membrane protein assembly factor BamE (lipoprotein component of BamABCDE complex)